MSTHKTNIVMLTNLKRHDLLTQTIRTLIDNTPHDSYNLTIIVDSPFDSENNGHLDLLTLQAAPMARSNITTLWAAESKHITGQLRNLGVYWAEKHWGRGEWLYLSDDDVYFTPNWLDKLTAAAGPLIRDWDAGVIGGWNHPFLQPKPLKQGAFIGSPTFDHGVVTCQIHDAVTGASQLMQWDIWDDYGPLDAHAPGIGQSEDWKFCVPAGQMIYGPMKLVENVDTSHEVVTHTGELLKPTECKQREYVGGIVHFKPRYGAAFCVTTEHPLLVSREGERLWQEAQQVRKSDFLIVPKPRPTVQYDTVLNTPIRSKYIAEDQECFRYTRTRRTSSHFPKAINLTPAIARLLGYFVSDGSVSTSEGQVQFHFHESQQSYVNDTRAILADLLGLDSSVDHQHGMLQVRANSVAFGDWLTLHCGRSKSRRAPAAVLNGPVQIMTNFLRGVFSGDGDKYDGNSMGITTSSRDFSHDLRYLFLLLGFYPAHYSDTARHRIFPLAKDLERFSEVVQSPYRERTCVKKQPWIMETDDAFEVSIGSIEIQSDVVTVYNFEVPENHSFNVNGFAVHNCQDIIKDGGVCASIYPRVVLNCGVRTSTGVESVGAKEMIAELEAAKKQYPDLIW